MFGFKSCENEIKEKRGGGGWGRNFSAFNQRRILQEKARKSQSISQMRVCLDIAIAENQKCYNKIIFKCVNNVVGSNFKVRFVFFHTRRSRE